MRDEHWKQRWGLLFSSLFPHIFPLMAMCFLVPHPACWGAPLDWHHNAGYFYLTLYCCWTQSCRYGWALWTKAIPLWPSLWLCLKRSTLSTMATARWLSGHSIEKVTKNYWEDLQFSQGTGCKKCLFPLLTQACWIWARKALPGPGHQQ